MNVSLCDYSTSLTLPVLDELRIGFINLSAIVFVVDGALAYFASEHIVFVC